VLNVHIVLVMDFTNLFYGGHKLAIGLLEHYWSLCRW